ncbi:MAG: ABC transporter substrate-binding protein [Rhodoblastus sp.]
MARFKEAPTMMRAGVVGAKLLLRGYNGAGFLIGALAIASAFSHARAGDARPQRIVSINQCTDELLLRLADRDRIASVSWLSQDAANSNTAELAAGMPVNHGLAEEVMAKRPDLVLASAYGSQTTINILRRLGVKVATFAPPNSLAEARAGILALADAIGFYARGEAMVAQMDADFAALAPEAHRPPLRAIVVQPNGFTAGKHSLAEDIMARAGLENLASRLDMGNYLAIPLEAVALEKADVLILDGEQKGAPSLATDALRHPIVASLGLREKVVSMPAKLWMCAGPNLVDAARKLIAGTRGAGQAAK